MGESASRAAGAATSATSGTTSSSTEERVVDAALSLLVRHGRDAVSTRAVCAAAGVQAPTIYRIFGGKRGLLDAVAARGLTSHLHARSPGPDGEDPVDDLRRGWDVHVAFGLANPYLYSLIYGEPRPGAPHRGAADEQRTLAARVRATAAAGRLSVGEEQAVRLLTAGEIGTTLTLLASPEGGRDPGFSPTAREAVLAAVVRDAPPARQSGLVGAATTLQALLPGTDALSAGEAHLLAEWLERLAARG